MRYYCAYFDIYYVPRALALIRSLQRHAGEFRLYALCFDEASFDVLTQAKLTGVLPLREDALIQFEPRLAEARSNRSRIEFFFTCTPALVLYVLDQVRTGEMVVYVDADLFFYSSPSPVESELGNGSILIYPHRFPWWLRGQTRFGYFNVGYLAFRNDPRARRCLTWWRDRCVEWCFDRLEGERFADQKYLDQWPALFEGVVVGRHWGAGLAPWNLGAAKLDVQNGHVLVHGDPLVFYHFHGLRCINPYVFYDRLLPLGAYASRKIVKYIYHPYLRELSAIMRDMNLVAPIPRRPSNWRSVRGLLQYLVSSYYVLAGEWLHDRRTARHHSVAVARPCD